MAAVVSIVGALELKYRISRIIDKYYIWQFAQNTVGGILSWQF